MQKPSYIDMFREKGGNFHFSTYGQYRRKQFDYTYYVLVYCNFFFFVKITYIEQ